MIQRWIALILACTVVIAAMAGCKPGAVVEEITLDTLADSLELEVGGTAVVAYSVSPEGTPVSFQSSDPDAFTVTADGEIRGIAGGEGHVTITAGELSAKVAVRIAAPEEEEAPELVELGIAIRTDHIVLAVGETHSLDDVLAGDDTDDLELFVEIGDFDILDMDDDGLLIALAPGETTVSLYNDDNFDETLLVTVVGDANQKDTAQSPFTLTQTQGGTSAQTAGGTAHSAAETTGTTVSAAEKAGNASSAPESTDGNERSAQESSLPESQPDSAAAATQVDVSAYAQEVVRLVNKERASAGLPALSSHSGLMSASHTRAQELVTLFSHTRPDGSRATAMASAATGSSYTGENIAKGYKSPSAVVKGWMNSSGHRANILREGFDQIGVGCYQSGGTLHWVQLFSGPGSSGGGSAGTGTGSGHDATSARTKKREALRNSTLSASSISLTVGGTQQLRVNLGSSDTTDVEVTWEADEGVTVSANGLVTATSAGNARVTAAVYFEGSPVVFLYCTVRVSEPESESSRESGSGNGGDTGGNNGNNATDGGATDPDPNEGSGDPDPEEQEPPTPQPSDEE